MKKERSVIKKLCMAGLTMAVFAGVINFPMNAYSETKKSVSDSEKDIKTTSQQKKEIKSGWKNEQGSWKYYKDGKVYTGWHWMTTAEGEKIPHWSYFGKDGKIYTGWKNMGKNEGEKTAHWSYFGANGWLRTGWQQMGKGTGNEFGENQAKHWSYFGPNGWLRTGWQIMGTTSNPDGKNKQHWSYFGTNGWLRTGWQRMSTSTNPDGNNAQHWSYFGGDGWLTVGWKNFTRSDGEKADHKTFFDSKGWLSTGIKMIDGKKYIFSKNNNGNTPEGWLLYDQSKNKSYSYTWKTGGLSYPKAVAHRGYNNGIPENSLEAYKEAANKGFKYVEADIAITKDGVFVLSHDPTINRCARTKDGKIISKNIYIKDKNYKELSEYDFGIYKSGKYKGLKISRLDDFLSLCKKLNLYPYIELKSENTPDEKHVKKIVELVKKYDMQNKVTWISFSDKLLEYVKIPGARKGYLVSPYIDEKKIQIINKWKKQGYDAFINIGNNYNPSDNEIQKCIQNNIAVEVWTIDNLNAMKKFNSYISGVTSDYIHTDRMF